VKIIGPGNIPHEAKHGLLTVGTFDGLHLGHKHVLTNLHNLSSNRQLPVTVITFSNHPRSVLFPEQQPELLSTLDEKLELFEKERIDYVYLIEFTVEFAKLSPLKFVENHIVPFEPSGLVIGREHFFGKNKEGNFELLQKFGHQFRFEVREAPEFKLDNVNVSSSEIRKLLHGGNIEEAAKLLDIPIIFREKWFRDSESAQSLAIPLQICSFMTGN
jgi:riboflavin kinase / FMN adenylyltransferase